MQISRYTKRNTKPLNSFKASTCIQMIDNTLKIPMVFSQKWSCIGINKNPQKEVHSSLRVKSSISLIARTKYQNRAFSNPETIWTKSTLMFLGSKLMVHMNITVSQISTSFCFCTKTGTILTFSLDRLSIRVLLHQFKALLMIMMVIPLCSLPS